MRTSSLFRQLAGEVGWAWWRVSWGHRGFPGRCHPPLPQDMEIRPRSCGPSSTGIISKRSILGGCSHSRVLPPHTPSPVSQTPGSRLLLPWALNPTPKSSRAGTLHCLSEPCSPHFFPPKFLCRTLSSVPELQALV